MTSVAVLVPLKAFGSAKSRLAQAMGERERAALASEMAGRVVDAALGATVYVATDDGGVAAWARDRGAEVVVTSGLDLNGSVAAAVDAATSAGAERLIVAHADLPLAEPFVGLATFPGVTLVPDRHDDGTNVVCLPASTPFVPMYGLGSFRRHLRQFLDAGHLVRISRRPDLQWDVDVPSDVPTGLLRASADV